jgi:hypothetical protein
MGPAHVLRDARARELEARDDVETAQAALERKARERTATAADAVLVAEVSRLVDEASEIQADLVRRRIVLRFLLHDLKLSGAEADGARSYLRQTELPGTRDTVAYTTRSCSPFQPHSSLLEWLIACRDFGPMGSA